ncbi:universal stress protein [Haloarchaeobius baliensis]|uniref:universal stress protein n=1 Tax=Haloarchaeobius baliensis TaxID=1670458 RepID=UPI003F884136
MERGLVLVEESDDHRALVAEAAEHAVGADAGLVLLHTMSQSDFEADAAALESIGRVEQANYDPDSILDGAGADVRSYVGDSIPDPVDVTVVGRATDDPAETVLSVASEHDCDHAFLLGAERSPTGKALFGDVAQEVILGFDGYVTLATY